MVKFGEPPVIRQIFQGFPLPKIHAIQYFLTSDCLLIAWDCYQRAQRWAFNSRDHNLQTTKNFHYLHI